MSKWIKFKEISRLDYTHDVYLDLSRVRSIQDYGDWLHIIGDGFSHELREAFAIQQIKRYFDKKSTPIEKLGDPPNGL